MGMIKISSLFALDRIVFSSSKTRKDILNEMISKSVNKVTDLDGFAKTVFAREDIVSTGLGQGYAIPHVKNDFVSEFFITVGIIDNGVEWDALDGKPVDIVFLIGGPDGEQNTYLSILSKLSLVIKNPKNKEILLNAECAEFVVDFFSKF